MASPSHQLVEIWYNHPMGIRVHPHPPRPPGPDCLDCSPYPWPSGATPTVIRVVFRGLANYLDWPEPPNGLPIHISNGPSTPCAWTSELFHAASRYLILYDAQTSRVILTRITEPFWELFNGLLAPCSIGPFANTRLYPDDSPIGGSAVLLDFPLSIIILLTETYNLQPDPDALYDVTESATPDHVVVRLTGRQQSGSVLIDLDTSAIPP